MYALRTNVGRTGGQIGHKLQHRAKRLNMKICIVGLDNLPVLAPELDQHGIGGEAVQRSLLARALARRGHAVSMVVGDYGQEDGSVYHDVTTYKAYRRDAGLPVLRFVHPRWTGVWAALSRADADVYYTSCAGMLVGLMAIFCRRNKRGLVFRLASDSDADPDQLLVRYWRDKKLYEYGLRRTDAILAQTVTQQQALQQNYRISSSIVADMLVDPPARDFGLAERDVDILWVSNLRPLKKPDLALELAHQLPHRRIHMVGGTQPGFQALFNDIRAQASQLANVTFHGHVPYRHASDYYDRARVFVNTSDIEGFPNSYLQSWRRGVPVVAFFDPDGIIRREGLGNAVSTLGEMSRAVESLLTDGAKWREMSERCRNYMERVHGDDTVLRPYIEAFELAGRKQRNGNARRGSTSA